MNRLRLFRSTLLVGTLLAGRAAAAPTPGATPATTPTWRFIMSGAAAGPTVNPNASLAQHTWWNHPDAIKALQLREDQRKKIDELFVASLDKEQAIQRKETESRRSLESALKNGDWSTARQASDEIADGMAKVWKGQTELKIDALAVLDAEQRKTIAEQYPQLLERPWLGSMGFGNPRRPPAGETGQPPAPPPQ